MSNSAPRVEEKLVNNDCSTEYTLQILFLLSPETKFTMMVVSMITDIFFSLNTIIAELIFILIMISNRVFLLYFIIELFYLKCAFIQGFFY